MCKVYSLNKYKVQSWRGLGIESKTCRIPEEKKVPVVLANALDPRYTSYGINYLYVDHLVLNHLN